MYFFLPLKIFFVLNSLVFISSLTALYKLPSEGVWELLKRALKSFSLLFPLSPLFSLLSPPLFFFSLCSGKQFPQGRKAWKLNSCPPWIQLTGRKSPNRSNLICLEEAGKTTFNLGASLKEAFINNVYEHHFNFSVHPHVCYFVWCDINPGRNNALINFLPLKKKKKADE